MIYTYDICLPSYKFSLAPSFNVTMNYNHKIKEIILHRVMIYLAMFSPKCNGFFWGRGTQPDDTCETEDASMVPKITEAI